MIILYDQNCSICTQIKNVLDIIDLDGAFTFTPISDHEVYEKYPQVNYWDARQSIHIIDKNGEVFKSEHAVIKILEEIRLVSRLALF